MKHSITAEKRAAQRAYLRAWRLANIDKVNEQQRLRRAANKAETAAYMREYQAANKERIREKQREWRMKNREKVIADRKRYKSANRASLSAKERSRIKLMQVEKPEQYRAAWKRANARRPAKLLARNEMLLGRKRPDACEACGGDDGGIVFDHCHTKGHPRGWICDRCNVALGCLKDSPDRLRKLIVYLERNRNGSSPQLAMTGI
jgi:rubrerythrin